VYSGTFAAILLAALARLQINDKVSSPYDLWCTTYKNVYIPGAGTTPQFIVHQAHSLPSFSVGLDTSVEIFMFTSDSDRVY